MIYLAIPYSHPEQSVKDKRFRIANAVAAELMCKGEVVYSPISHTHIIAKENHLTTDWDYWQSACEQFLTIADKLVVITIEGWKESTGVQAEIDYAKQHDIPIEYKPLR